jgi:hypothetical protein
MGFRGTVGSRKWLKYILDWPLRQYFIDEFYVYDFAVTKVNAYPANVENRVS